MTMEHTIYTAMKGATWEDAKGKLRALVVMKGSVPSRDVRDTGEQPWEALQSRVEAFIKDVEDEGLHE